MAGALHAHYAVRDVEDVESYVRDRISNIAGERPDDYERLVARGVLLVERIASALPPETSLAGVLQRVLPGMLAGYRRESERGDALTAAVPRSRG